jgi:transglutaminase-like putative cysteine protease
MASSGRARSRSCLRGIASAVAVALACLAAAGSQAQTREHDSWMGVYFNGAKVGYSSEHSAPTTYNGQPAVHVTSRSVMHMTLLGTTVEQDETEDFVTKSDSTPIEETLDVKSNGSEMHIQATYDLSRHEVRCRIAAGGHATTKTLAIPEGAVLATDPSMLAEGRKLAVGQKLTFTYLNPISIALEQAQLEVTGKETITDASTSKLVATFVVKSNTPLGDFVTWETDDGDTIKGEMRLGGITLAMLKETPEGARQPAAAHPSTPGSYVPPADFAIQTAVKVDRAIANERQVRSLQATISGIPQNALLLSDDRQRVTDVTGAPPALAAKFDVNAKPFDPSGSARLPIKDPALAAFRKKAPYLDIGDVNIESTAARLRAGDSNAYEVCVRIRNWVHRVMTPDASIGVPRSASDIFLRRRGVCRDFATLYAALARSAGVPTRLCAGIVYGNGMFFYHAWAESWVGQWVAFDPTLYRPGLAADFVDATHIKFAEGDVTDMFGAVALIGKLRITILNAE